MYKETELTKKRQDLELFEMEMLQFFDRQLKNHVNKGLISLSIALTIKIGQAIIEKDS